MSNSVNLEVSGIAVSYGDNAVLHRIDLTLHTGEVVVLVGASGSGKTTLLRTIAGLQDATEGTISITGKVVHAPKQRINLPPEKRGLGMVFQSYALWPHKSVLDNVLYGLRVRRTDAKSAQKAAMVALEKVGLAGLEARYPSQLSGGQQQRVALARAMAYEPPIVLMDEPLSNLDAKLRDEARAWLKQVIVEQELSAVMVTHDQSEAMAIADRIVLLIDGVIEQQGSPMEIYNKPTSLKSALYFGTNNVLKGTVESSTAGATFVGPDGISIPLGAGSTAEPGASVFVFRAENVDISTEASGGGIPAKLITAMYLGSRWEYLFEVAGEPMKVFSEKALEGDNYYLTIDRDKAFVFPSA